MMKILVTGGAGFIGSNFIKYILKKNKDIYLINIDKLTYAGNKNNVIFTKKIDNYIFINEDICDTEKIKDVFNEYRPDCVINFAAETHVDRSIESSNAFVKTNVLGVQVLLKLSLDYKVEKFIQISTDEVYGSNYSNEFVNEDYILKPGNPYAASKAGAEMLVMSFVNTYNFPAIITRCSNNYGPGQHYEKFIPTVIKNMIEGKKVPVYGDGTNVRDWIHVDDNCSAIYTIMKNWNPGQIYNISAYNEKNNIDLVKDIAKILDKDINDIEKYIDYVKDRKGHDLRYGISSEKIRKTLGWVPKIPFEKGLSNTINWYIKNYEIQRLGEYNGDTF